MSDTPSTPPSPRHRERTHRKPPTGWLDRALRAGKSITHGLLMIPIYLVASLLIGTAITPAVCLFRLIAGLGENASPFLQVFTIGIGIAVGFFTYGFAIMIVVPIANFTVRWKIKADRGPYHGAQFFPWYLHNSLTYIVRYSFLDYATPTPMNHMYFALMGMKIGKNVQINTSNISDAALLTVEDNVTIGGSATIIAHYAQGGFLILAPTIIRKGATVGILATVMAGVDIGEGAKILPNSVVLPKTKIPAGETWGGVPARKIDLYAQE